MSSKKCPRKVTQKEDISWTFLSTKCRQKCPRDVTPFVHEMSPIMSTKCLPPVQFQAKQTNKPSETNWLLGELHKRNTLNVAPTRCHHSAFAMKKGRKELCIRKWSTHIYSHTPYQKVTITCIWMTCSRAFIYHIYVFANTAPPPFHIMGLNLILRSLYSYFHALVLICRSTCLFKGTFSL